MAFYVEDGVERETRWSLRLKGPENLQDQHGEVRTRGRNDRRETEEWPEKAKESPRGSVTVPREEGISSRTELPPMLRTRRS